jgi:DNA-binding MarR family transcriptional regulator
MTRSPKPVQFYQAGSYQAEESVGYLMKGVMMSIVQQADKGLSEHDLTMVQWVPLKHMQSKGSCTVAELARWSNTDAGAMTRLLDRLEKKGLCKRLRSTEDRRVVQVALTPEGEASLVQVPAVMANVMNQHLAGFSKSEWLALKSYLTRMIENGEALRDAG